MDNHENKPAVAGEGTQNGGQKNNRHRRHHRPNRNGRPQNATEAQNNGAVKAAPTEQNGEKKDNRQANNPPQKEGENRQPREGGNNRHGRNRHGRNRYPREKGPMNPYELPNGETAESLADLRAQIVLKSADGTVPAPVSARPMASTPLRPVSATPVSAVSPISAPNGNADAPAFDSASDDLSDVDLSLILGEAAAPAEEDDSPKVEVVGVRFRSSGKTYYFAPGSLKADKGDFVIVETAHGTEFGEVTLQNSMVSEKNVILPLKPILRFASDADRVHNEENREKEQKALVICREKIAAHGLEMKLIDVQYAFDNSKLLFYFSSEGRVDFRELVKDLASVFHTRIELRQIGIRDEAKLLGGLGACGRPLCCSSFLPDFVQVSIKMAKDQNLSLNSSKISGVCGRLMCCLHYEAETYAEEIKKTPSNDSIVKTEDGVGVVISSNPLAGTVRVIMKDAQDQTPRQYHRDAVTVIGKEKRGQNKEKDSSKKEAAQEEKA